MFSRGALYTRRGSLYSPYKSGRMANGIIWNWTISRHNYVNGGLVSARRIAFSFGI